MKIFAGSKFEDYPLKIKSSNKYLSSIKVNLAGSDSKGYLWIDSPFENNYPASL